MAAEIWDLYDGCGEKTGHTMVRGEAIPRDFITSACTSGR